MDTPGSGPVTTATVAAHLGLSRATVIHVLNGHGTQQRIRPETQRRVLEAARELGYRPNLSARAVRTGRFGSIALVQSLKDLYFPMDLQQGIVEALSEHNMHLSLAEVPEEVLDEEGFVPQVVRELMADGLLINRIRHIPPALIARINALRTPAIYLNVKEEFDSVHPDDLAGGRVATESLLARGHTRIVYAQGQVAGSEHYSRRDRRDGYARSMASAGMAARVFELSSHQGAAVGETAQWVAAAKGLLSQQGRPSGIIAYELAEAMAFVRAADQLGLDIPRDLSLIVFHWGIDGRLCVPLTTVTNAMRRVGREAVRMLLEKIQVPGLPSPSRTVPVDLLPGGTCGPPLCR